MRFTAKELDLLANAMEAWASYMVTKIGGPSLRAGLFGITESYNELEDISAELITSFRGYVLTAQNGGDQEVSLSLSMLELELLRSAIRVLGLTAAAMYKDAAQALMFDVSSACSEATMTLDALGRRVSGRINDLHQSQDPLK